MPLNYLDLGPEICRARPLSLFQTARAQGFSPWLMLGLVLPFFALPFWGLMIGSGLTCLLFGGLPQGALHQDHRALWFLGFAGLGYLLAAWFVYVLPRGDHFILHENALRIRQGFQRRTIPLASISAISAGRTLSQVEKVAHQINRIAHPEIARLASHLHRHALTILLNDGKRHVFKAILTRFDPADIEQLFTELLQRHPRLACEAPDGPTLIQ